MEWADNNLSFYFLYKAFIYANYIQKHRLIYEINLIRKGIIEWHFS